MVVGFGGSQVVLGALGVEGPSGVNWICGQQAVLRCSGGFVTGLVYALKRLLGLSPQP